MTSVRRSSTAGAMRSRSRCSLAIEACPGSTSTKRSMSPPLRSSRARDPKRRILAVGPKTSRTAARIASTSRDSNRMARVYPRAVGWAQDSDEEHGGGLARGPGGPPPPVVHRPEVRLELGRAPAALRVPGVEGGRVARDLGRHRGLVDGEHAPALHDDAPADHDEVHRGAVFRVDRLLDEIVPRRESGPPQVEEDEVGALTRCDGADPLETRRARATGGRHL